MKNSLKVIAFLVASLVLVGIGRAQSDLIITKSDTISNVEINRKKSKTNAAFVTFRKGSETRKLDAGQVERLFANDDLFVSVEISNQANVQAIVQYVFHGEVGLYTAQHNLNGKWKENFYLIDSSGKCFSLHEHQDNLPDFLRSHLADFEAFESTYDRRIKFTYSSLGTMISHYNHFLAPDQYEAVKFKPRNNEKIIYTLAGAVIAGYFIMEVSDGGGEPTPFTTTQ